MCPENNNKDSGADYLDIACRMQLLPDLAERYIVHCRELSVQRKRAGFPNLAGFLRYCGFGGSAAERLRRDYPESYSALCLAFEDEALNSDTPATVLSSYLKKRLGYGEADDGSASCDAGQLRLVFEHDITKDGE